jgi:hypothetical protein
MSTPYDLTTAAAVQAWLASAGAAAGVADLAPLISGVSRQILSNLGRQILPAVVAQALDGDGSSEIMLREWPVVSVASLAINGVAIAAAPPLVANGVFAPGYMLESAQAYPPGRPQSLSLRGYGFYCGQQNVLLSYVAGYQISAEAQTVSGGAATVSAPFGPWASDQGVVYATTGVKLVKVSGAPAVGQYQLGGSPGAYVFNAADNAAGVLISYGFVPQDLQNAASAWCAEIVSYRSRIGRRSQSLGGQETVSYIVDAMPKQVDAALQPYRRVFA